MGRAPKKIPCQLGFINPKVEFGWDYRGNWGGILAGARRCWFVKLHVHNNGNNSTRWTERVMEPSVRAHMEPDAAEAGMANTPLWDCVWCYGFFIYIFFFIILGDESEGRLE